MNIVSVFDAAQAAEAVRLGRILPDQRPHPAAKLLLRVHKNDLLAFGTGEERKLLRVVKMSGGQLVLAQHYEAGNLKQRDQAKDDSFRYIYASTSRLRKEGARKVYVTPDGRVIDHGPVL